MKMTSLEQISRKPVFASQEKMVSSLLKEDAREEELTWQLLLMNMVVSKVLSYLRRLGRRDCRRN